MLCHNLISLHTRDGVEGCPDISEDGRGDEEAEEEDHRP